MQEARLSRAILAAALLSALAVAACGAGGQSTSAAVTPGEAEPAASAPAESTPAEAEPASSPEANDVSAAATAPEPAPAAAPPPNPVALCNKMCDRMASLCSKSAATACRVHCEQYEHPPAGCDEQIRGALECAAKADDLTCVIIAPESCAPHFRRVVACSTGKEDPGAPESTEARLPDGWERFEAKPAGFAVPMPRGVTPQPDAKEPTFAVSEGPATYSVRVAPLPKHKPTPTNMVALATNQLGTCSRKLKLFGRIDRPERTSIRYDSRCADGGERRGALVFASNKLYVLQIASPAGVKVEADAFVYGFELL